VAASLLRDPVRLCDGTYFQSAHFGELEPAQEAIMARGALLWMFGIPIPIIVLVWLLGALH
jgi:hypothetical protein